MSVKLCECGCGKPTDIATQNNSYKRWVKGKGKHFINHHHVNRRMNPNWNGGRKNERGYILILVGDDSYVREHRIIAENTLGRKLNNNEIVHHINGDRSDNRKTNLLICDRSYHIALHKRLKNNSNWPQFKRSMN